MSPSRRIVPRPCAQSVRLGLPRPRRPSPSRLAAAPPRHIARGGGGSPPRCVAWQVAHAGSFAGASPCAPHSRAGHGVRSPHPRHGRGTAQLPPSPPHQPWRRAGNKKTSPPGKSSGQRCIAKKAKRPAYFFMASSTATATATVAPTIGLLPMPMRPIISTCAGTDEEPANWASECMRPIVSVMP